MNAFGLAVRFVLKPGAGEAFDALMRSTLEGIRADEPDTVMYVVHTVEGEPDVRVFYELYRTADALRDHERQATTRYFLDHRDEYVASYTVDRLTPYVGKGLESLGVEPS
jgi:quinol monooxygenase YgiN